MSNYAVQMNDKAFLSINTNTNNSNDANDPMLLFINDQKFPHGYISVSIVTIDLYAFYRLFVLSDSNEANVPMLLYMNVSIDL